MMQLVNCCKWRMEKIYYYVLQLANEKDLLLRIVYWFTEAHSHFPGQFVSSAGQAFAIRFNKFQRPALK